MAGNKKKCLFVCGALLVSSLIAGDLNGNSADDKDTKQTEQSWILSQHDGGSAAKLAVSEKSISTKNTEWDVSLNADSVITVNPYFAIPENLSSSFKDLPKDMNKFEQVNYVEIKAPTGEESVAIIPKDGTDDVKQVTTSFKIGNYDVTYGVNLAEGKSTKVSVDGKYNYELDGKENEKFTTAAKDIKTKFEEGTLTGDDVTKFVDDTKNSCNTARMHDEIARQTADRTSFPGSLLLSTVFGKNSR
jgi:hypothetical protein